MTTTVESYAEDRRILAEWVRRRWALAELRAQLNAAPAPPSGGAFRCERCGRAIRLGEPWT